MKGQSLAEIARRKPKAEEAPAPAEKRYPRMSLYLPNSAIRDIRKLAVELGIRPHDLLIEGIDLMLKQHGRPSVAEHRERERS